MCDVFNGVVKSFVQFFTLITCNIDSLFCSVSTNQIVIAVLDFRDLLVMRIDF